MKFFSHLKAEQINPKYLFAAIGTILLASVAAAVYMDEMMILALPLILILLLATVADFKRVFLGIFILLPISAEIELPGGFGTDLPSEPLMVYLMLCLILFCLGNPKKIDYKFFNHPMTQLVLVHLLWIGVSAIFSKIFFISFKFFLAKIWYIATFYFLVGMFIKKAKDFRPAFWGILLPLMMVAVYAMLRHSAYGFDFEDVNKTMGPFFRNHVDYAVMLALVLPFMLVIRKWYDFGKIPRFTINVGFIIVLLGIFFAYTRAAYVSVFIIPIAYFIFNNRLIKPAITAGLVALTFGLTFMIVGNNYLNFAPDFDKTIYHTDLDDHLSATLQLQDVSTVERFHRWIAGIAMSNDEKTTGFGPGNFYHFYKSYTTSLFETYVSDNEEHSTVHNYFLLVLIEQGWPGFIIFMALIIYFFVWGERVCHQSKDKKDKQLAMAILICQLMIMANLFMADLIETDEIGSLFFINMAILVNIDLRNQRALEDNNDNFSVDE